MDESLIYADAQSAGPTPQVSLAASAPRPQIVPSASAARPQITAQAPAPRPQMTPPQAPAVRGTPGSMR